MKKFALFLLFEAVEFMYVNIDSQILANLIYYTKSATIASWATVHT